MLAVIVVLSGRRTVALFAAVFGDYCFGHEIETLKLLCKNRQKKVNGRGNLHRAGAWVLRFSVWGCGRSKRAGDDGKWFSGPTARQSGECVFGGFCQDASSQDSTSLAVVAVC